MYKYFLPWVLAFTGCTGPNQVIQSTDFDSEEVRAIRFNLYDIRGSELETFNKHQLNEVSGEISRRFSQAGYAVTDAESNEPNKNVSHNLEASAGVSEFTETPIGFSFGLGNSDPRSSNFQKGDSVPITCTLRSRANPDQAMILKERKSLPSTANALGLGTAQQAQKRKRFYIENIGSTCHNLLSKLQIFPTNNANVEAAKQFAPIVRIETESTEAKHEAERDETKTTPTARTTPVQPDAKLVHQANTDASTEKGKQRKNTQPPVAVKNDEAADWRNKTMKIFNQGDTVILKFGNERR